MDNRERLNSQGSLFPCEPASKEGRALLALFYFFRRSADQGSLSLCVERFRPLETVFETRGGDLKKFFCEHGQIGGYVASAFIANQDYRRRAFEYADNQVRLLTGRATGALLVKTDPLFPSELSRSRFPVNWIFCHHAPLRSFPRPRVAVVGSRHSSPKQLELAKSIAQIVADNGGTVITGLASGADSAAYSAVRGTTHAFVGVLGSGIRRMYPAEHKRLLDELTRSRGVAVTEVPPEIGGNAISFIQRNRIIAALADLVVTVSGGYNSGTAHTVRFAADAEVPVVSADPDENSGIGQLVLELGGRRVPASDLPELIRSLGK